MARFNEWSIYGIKTVDIVKLRAYKEKVGGGIFCWLSPILSVGVIRYASHSSLYPCSKPKPHVLLDIRTHTHLQRRKSRTLYNVSASHIDLEMWSDHIHSPLPALMSASRRLFDVLCVHVLISIIVFSIILIYWNGKYFGFGLSSNFSHAQQIILKFTRDKAARRCSTCVFVGIEWGDDTVRIRN